MSSNNLFNILPENFFSPLVYGNKLIYNDIIFLIFKAVQNGLSYGVEREILIDYIEDYLNSSTDQIILEDAEENIRTVRDKANALLRKLVECGWIYIETTNNYKQIVNLNDYSITIISAFEKIINNEKMEYQGSIISIFSLLFTEEKVNSGLIIKEISQNTRDILSGLKTLNANIKKYMDNLTKQKSAEDIMKTLFVDYTQKIIDKSYHRLKTSENISKYRPKILDRLEELLYKEDFLEEAGGFYKEEDELESLELGVNQVKNIIFNVITAFNSLDDIISDIDNKNTKYGRAAVTRAKFLLNNSRDITGQIKLILNYACETYKELELKLSSDYLEELSDLFTLYSYGFIDESSLYKANEGKKSFKPKEINRKTLSKEERDQKLKSFKEAQEKRYGIKKINKIVKELLGDRKMVSVKDIQLETMEDFIKIIYIRVLAASPLAGYKVKPTESIINKDGFSLRNFEVWR